MWCPHTSQRAGKTSLLPFQASLTLKQFKWTFVNTSGQVQSITTTPLSFYQSIIPLYNLPTSICMINDPRNRYATLWNSKRDGNIVRGRAIKWLNVDVEVMKNVARKLLEASPSSCPVVRVLMRLGTRPRFQFGSLAMSKRERTRRWDCSTTSSIK
jgi:hypothetical protein